MISGLIQLIFISLLALNVNAQTGSVEVHYNLTRQLDYNGIILNFTHNYVYDQGNMPTLTFYHLNALHVCINRYAPPPQVEAYSNYTCTYLQTVEASTTKDYINSTIFLPNDLRNVLYYFGIAPLQNVTDKNFTVTLDGRACNDSTAIYNSTSKACEVPQPVNKGGNWLMQNGDVKVFSFYVDNNTGNFTVTLTASVDNPDVVLNASFALSPLNGISDVNVGSPVMRVDFPRIGQWFLAVQSKDTRQFKFNVTYTPNICTKPQYFGPNCDIYVRNKTEVSLNLTINANEVQYYTYTTSIKAPLWVVVRRLDYNTEPPKIAVSYNQLPTSPTNQKSLSADVAGCNQINCVVTDRIKTIPVNQTMTWFIAVYGGGSANGTRYGLWFNSTCPTLCPIRGTCTELGPMTGQCNCTATTYYGLDCYNIMEGFFWYDWILIGIGAGMGTVILLGILLFMCMRGSKPEFDKVEYSSIQ